MVSPTVHIRVSTLMEDFGVVAQTDGLSTLMATHVPKVCIHNEQPFKFLITI